MMCRRLLLCLFLGFLHVACTSETDSKKVIAGVAEQYCMYLLNGDYEAYVRATYRQNELREEDLAELADNLKMFIRQQENEHGGIKKAEVKSVEIDENNSSADVFILFTYGDKTQETVLQPMIKKDGLWYLQ